MATIGLVSLTERLLNQTAGQAQEPQAAAPNRTSANNGAFAATEDQFTPSAPNAAQAAGLFTVSQITLFSPAAEFLLAQTPDPQANPVNAADTAANFAAPRSATAANAAAARAAASAPATTSANIQHQLQLLNNALAALGLNSTDIQKIDSIAGLIDDFEPTRFANLAFQLQALAQQSASPAVPQATPQGTPQAAPQAPSNTPATAGASVPGSNAATAPAAGTGSAIEPGRQ